MEDLIEVAADVIEEVAGTKWGCISLIILLVIVATILYFVYK